MVKPNPKKSRGYEPLTLGDTTTAGLGLMLPEGPKVTVGLGVAKVELLIRLQLVTWPMAKLKVRLPPVVTKV